MPSRKNRGMSFNFDNAPQLQEPAVKVGIIQSVDYDAGTAIVDLGDCLTPPLKWKEEIGSLKTWKPPENGNQVLLLAPNNDWANAIIFGSINFDDAPQIGQSKNPIIAAGGIKLTFNIDSGAIEIEGNININGNINASGDIIAGGISLKSHIHSGVKGGTDKTGAPQ